MRGHQHCHDAIDTIAANPQLGYLAVFTELLDAFSTTSLCFLGKRQRAKLRKGSIVSKVPLIIYYEDVLVTV